MDKFNRSASLYAEIGSRIRKFRKLRGITQGDLAGQCDLERTSISNIEKARQRVPMGRLYSIANALGISINDLLPSPNEVGVNALPVKQVARVNHNDSRKTLRDEFAMAALAGTFALETESWHFADRDGVSAEQYRAEWAYKQADAMMKAREAHHDPQA